MDSIQFNIARRARARCARGTVVIVLGGTALVAGSHAQVPHETPEPSGHLTAESKLTKTEVLDPRRVSIAVALGADRAREITSEDDLEITSHEVLAARIPGPVTSRIMEGGQLEYALPYRFADFNVGVTDRLLLRAVAVVERGGLRVDPETVQFRSSVRVGIINEDDPAVPREELAAPVSFQLTFSSGNVNPSDLEVTHTSLPFQRVELGAMDFREPPKLNIRASFDPLGEDIEIPVIPLEVLSVPEAIPGLGFGFGDVGVQLPGFLAGKITEVTLSTSRGSLRPILVPLSASGHGHSVLRSTFMGAGEARVSVERSDLAFAPATVSFVWPWMLILAAVAGAGLSGGLFARTNTTGGFLVGFLAGFAIGVAICAGINVTDLRAPEVASVAVAFFFAASPGVAVAKKIWKQPG
jgi:hypothetical protein